MSADMGQNIQSAFTIGSKLELLLKPRAIVVQCMVEYLGYEDPDAGHHERERNTSVIHAFLGNVCSKKK